VSTSERILEYAAIAAGGVVGSLARAALDAVLPAAANEIPWSTFVANVSGSLLLGALSSYLQIRAAPPALRLFVTVGLLGSYTTFSTFALQLNHLVGSGHLATAALYVGSSLVLGLAAATAGFHFVERRAALAP